MTLRDYSQSRSDWQPEHAPWWLCLLVWVGASAAGWWVVWLAVGWVRELASRVVTHR